MITRDKLETIAGHALTAFALALAGVMFWLGMPGDNSLTAGVVSFALIPLIVSLMPEHRWLWLTAWRFFRPAPGVGLSGRNPRLRR